MSRNVRFHIVAILYLLLWGYLILSKMEEVFPPAYENVAAMVEREELWTVEIDGVTMDCLYRPKVTDRIKLIGCNGTYGLVRVIIKEYETATVSRKK